MMEQQNRIEYFKNTLLTNKGGGLHTFTTLLPIILICLTYLRPWESFVILQNLHLTAVFTALSIISIFITPNLKRGLFLKIPSNKWIFLFVVTCTISIPFSVWIGGSFDEMKGFLPVLLMYLILINAIDRQEKLKILLWTFILIIMLHAGHALREYFSGRLPIETARISGFGGSIFENANNLAAIFVLFLPVSVLLFNITHSKLGKLIAILAFVTLASGILASQSRGGMLGLGVTLILLFLFTKRKISVLFILLIFGIFVATYFPEKTFNRLEDLQNYEEDTSAMGRIYAWRGGIKMMLDNPILGVGFGQFMTAFGTKYRPKDIPTKLYGENFWLKPHNSFIQIGGELGFTGLLLFLLILFSIYKNLRRLMKLENSTEENRFLRNYGALVIVSFIGFLFCNIFSHLAYSTPMYTLFALGVIPERIMART